MGKTELMMYHIYWAVLLYYTGELKVVTVIHIYK